MVKRNKLIVPRGAKVISIISIILSILFLLYILVPIVGYIAYLFGFSILNDPNLFLDVTLLLSLLIPIITLIFGINVLKRKDWARIGLGIIFSLIFLYGVFISLLSLIVFLMPLPFVVDYIYSLLILIVSGFIAWYLLFNKKVRDAFKNK